MNLRTAGFPKVPSAKARNTSTTHRRGRPRSRAQSHAMTSGMESCSRSPSTIAGNGRRKNVGAPVRIRSSAVPVAPARVRAREPAHILKPDMWKAGADVHLVPAAIPREARRVLAELLVLRLSQGRAPTLGGMRRYRPRYSRPLFLENVLRPVADENQNLPRNRRDFP